MKKLLFILAFVLYSWLLWNHGLVQSAIKRCHDAQSFQPVGFFTEDGQTGTELLKCNKDGTAYSEVVVVGLAGWEEILNPFNDI